MDENNKSNNVKELDLDNIRSIMQINRKYFKRVKNAIYDEINDIQSIKQQKINEINKLLNLKNIFVENRTVLLSKINFNLFDFNPVDISGNVDYIKITNYIINYLTELYEEVKEQEFEQDIYLLINILRKGVEYNVEVFENLQRILNNIKENKKINDREKCISMLDLLKAVLQDKEISEEINEIDQSIEIYKKEINELNEQTDSLIDLGNKFESNIYDIKNFINQISNEKVKEIVQTIYKNVSNKIIIETRIKISKDNEILFPEFEQIYEELKIKKHKKFTEVAREYFEKGCKGGKRYLLTGKELSLESYLKRVKRYKDGKLYKEYQENHKTDINLSKKLKSFKKN